MTHPKGELKQGRLRANFDRLLTLEFHGSDVTPDAGSLAFRELDASVERAEMAGDVLFGSRAGKNGRHRLASQFRENAVRFQLRDQACDRAKFRPSDGRGRDAVPLTVEW